MSIDRIISRLKSLVTMGRVRGSSSAAGARGMVTVESLAPSDELPMVQPYGLASRPQAGAEAVIVQVGSNPDQAIIIATDDRRYRIALEAGEVAIYDDLGSKIHLMRGGEVEVEGVAIKLGAGATLGAARVGDSVSIASPWLTWLTGLATHVSYLATVPPSALGTISTGSSKVEVE